MDKFLIDPPENITEKLTIPIEDNSDIPTGPPTLQPVSNPVLQPVSNPVLQPVSDPVLQPVSDPVLQPVSDPVLQPVSDPVLQPVSDPVSEVVIEPVLQRTNWTFWFWWIFIFVTFLIITLYYGLKYTLYESKFILKKNASTYQISLDEMKEDIKHYLRTWIEWFQDLNENINDKTNQYFFKQHVQNGAFKVKKYKIPKYLITPTENPTIPAE
jgi:hypothetical protein